MTPPKIAADDALLFGSLSLVAIGAALVTFTTTNDLLGALGVALVVFGVPSKLITLLAAGETK
jgi:hypothetical protein